MKNRIRNGLFGLAMVAVAALAFSSCSLILALLGAGADIRGTVVDARTGTGMDLTNASVTLVNTTTGDTYSPTVDSVGDWYVNSISKGTYQLEVSEGGYFFTSFTYPVTYAGSQIIAPTIAGIYTASFSGTVSFILMWSTPQQLDLHMTFPSQTIWTATGTPPILGTPSAASEFVDSPIWQPTDSTMLGYWDQGFGPNGTWTAGSTTMSQAGRVDVSDYSSSSTWPTDSSSAAAVTMDTTASSYGPTTITVWSQISYPVGYDMPLSNTGTQSDSYPYNLLDSSFAPTNLQGVAQLYADAPTTSAVNYISNPSGTTSYAVLYVVGQATATHPDGLLGKIVIPTGFQIETASLLRMNMTDTEDQLVPDVAWVTPGGFRSVTGTSSTSNGVINIAFPKTSGK